MDYKKAGVDIEAGYKSVELMKEHIKKTMRKEVLTNIGGFSGAFSLSTIKDMEEPVLLSGTDGCGTKVKLAMVMDKHDTIGIDAVATASMIACRFVPPPDTHTTTLSIIRLLFLLPLSHRSPMPYRQSSPKQQVFYLHRQHLRQVPYQYPYYMCCTSSFLQYRQSLQEA